MEPMPGPRTSRRAAWIGIGAVAAVLAVVAAVVWMLQDDAAADVTLAAADQPGPDPFTDSIQIGAVPDVAPPAATAVRSTQSALPTDAATGTLVATGTTPGLYGGSNDKDVCDPAKLVAFLKANPGKAAAWGAVLGVAPGAIEAYVAKLTPVVLTADTAVTNHGFRDGKATTLPSVLQAGTAVMVDAAGVPRVKCNCGNPLTPPAVIDLRDVSTTGDAWDGYRVERVVTVRDGSTVTELVLVDLSTGERLTRPIGAADTTTDQGTISTRLDGRWTVSLRKDADLTAPYEPGDVPAGCPTPQLDGASVAITGGKVTITRAGSLGELRGSVFEPDPSIPGASLGGVTIVVSPKGADRPELTFAVVGGNGGVYLTRDASGRSAIGDCRLGVTMLPEGSGGGSPATSTAPSVTTATTAAPATTGAAAAGGLCDRDTIRSAMAELGIAVDFVEVVNCNGKFAAIGYTEGGFEDELSGFLEWNGNAWTRGDCEKYLSTDASNPHSDVVPDDIFLPGCWSN